MEGSCQGNNRRHFLKTAAASSAVLATSSSLLAAQDKSPIPLVTLGKTGVKVTKLGMGTSWAVAESFVQRAITAGVGYIDTSETYERGKAEIALGNVFARTGQRKDVYLVTKNSSFEGTKGSARAKTFITHLQSSLERLKTDYVDCYYIHGISGKEIDLFTDPLVIKAFEELKRTGKIKFAGFSCHDRMLPELIEAGAKSGWIDQMMIKYNFREMQTDKLNRAIDVAAKANLGIIAMKTQQGAAAFEFKADETDPKILALKEKGFKAPVAAIKKVLSDDRIHMVVSEMTNFDELRQNTTAVVDPLTPKEARLLEEHRVLTANRYCHGCGHLCETAAKGVPVATVLRYYRYYEAYGKREAARELYRALPPESRAIIDLDLVGLDAACPHGLPVADLLKQADKHLGQV